MVRSRLWQLSEVLEYSSYVHGLGAGLLTLFWLVLKFGFRAQLHLGELLEGSPARFVDHYPIEGSLIFGLYPIYILGACPRISFQRRIALHADPILE